MTGSSQPRFGVLLREWRRQKGLTLVDVADAAGISIVHMSDIERSRRNPPGEDTIRAIARRLGQESEVERLLALAALQRGSVEIPLAQKRNPPELAETLVALARRCDQGDVDGEFVAALKDLLANMKESK